MSHAMSPSQKIARPSRRLLILSALVCLALLVGLWRDWMPALAMDMARVETRTDLAVSTYGVSGQGVIVAILDRGIDWKNNDFRNANGTTRIKYIFDLTDNTGAGDPGNPYGRGTIYTEAQINAALTMGGPTLATRDAVGHGSTTAGIAAGNGRNLPSQKYRGIAPNATIISVKVTSEGAPAHDAEPAEAVFNDATAYPVAIDFVRDKKLELGMPAVMLLNLGSIGGPTDGTSSLARKIDATVGPGIPGLVFVSGPGDDGGMPNHAGGVVTQGGTSSIQIQKGSASTLIFDLWYDGNDRFDVSLQTPNGNFGPFTSPTTNNDQGFVTNPTFTYFHKGANLDFFGATNGKREIFIQLTGPVGTYTVQLQGATVSNGRFDATLNPSNIHQQPPAQSNRFLNFVVPGSIWDGATSLYNICPNDYVIRTNWTDIDGLARSNTGQGNIGELWLGSSVGPTFDGRLGVDISAPGDSVFTTYNPTSYFATFRFNMIQDGNGFYGRANAVSAAAPQVTGIIALMLEANPQLTAAQVKNILHLSARSDGFTGSTPNANWGWGKVDALRAVDLALTAPTAAPATISGSVTTPDGSPLGGALMRLSGALSRTTVTDSAGNYHFDNVDTSNLYSVTPSLANYSFAPASRSFSLMGNMTDAGFTANPDATQTTNPLDTPEYFVRQHYLDFLGREPDESGFAFWSDQILECGTDTNCIERRRTNVSAAYFLSIEFQQTGGLVDGLYRASYRVRPQFAEFMPDTRAVARDVVVGREGWQAKLEANKQTFVNGFVQRPTFVGVYGNMDNDMFVDTLISHTGVSFTTGERDALVTGLVDGTLTRSAVLRSIAENNRFVSAKFNEAFVMMEYFGYLRRDPDESGYAFWLNKLSEFNGNFEQAEMVKAFIVSGEYRARFLR